MTNLTRNYQLLPIIRSYLLMDGNHDPIARIEPGKKYWGSYKLKSSMLMSTKENPCEARHDYHQQSCLQSCFGYAVYSSLDCRHCQSVFMHANFSSNATDNATQLRDLDDHDVNDVCDPWQWFSCNNTQNHQLQSSAVVKCMEKCVLACHDQSFDYTVTSVTGDEDLSAKVGWQKDFFEISENRSIFILAASRRPNKHLRIRQYPLVDLASGLCTSLQLARSTHPLSLQCSARSAGTWVCSWAPQC